MEFLNEFPEGIEAHENLKVIDITGLGVTSDNVTDHVEGTNIFNFYRVEDKEYLVVAKTAVFK